MLQADAFKLWTHFCYFIRKKGPTTRDNFTGSHGMFHIGNVPHPPFYAFQNTYRMSHQYWANFWLHKRVRVPKYGSRFPSTGPILWIYSGPGSWVRVQVPEYRNGLAQYRWLIRYPSMTVPILACKDIFFHLRNWIQNAHFIHLQRKNEKKKIERE